MSPRYVPDVGDLIWLEFDPQSGHEQAGKRPGLVLSPAAYNGPSGLVIVCPVTNQAKGYPFEVPLPPGLRVRGVILADQVISLDWKARKASKSDVAPKEVMEDVLAKLSTLLSL